MPITNYKLVLLTSTKGLTPYQRSQLKDHVKLVLQGTETPTILAPMLGRGREPVMDEAIKVLQLMKAVTFESKVFMRDSTNDVLEWIKDCDQYLAFPARSRQLGITSDRVWTITRHLQKQKKVVHVVYPWASHSTGDLLDGPIR